MLSAPIRQAALLHDTISALMRVQVSQDVRELDALNDEQIRMWIKAIKAEPGDQAWAYAKARGVVQ